MTKEILFEQINTLKEKKNAVILAHNYQVPEVQDIADFVGIHLGCLLKREKQLLI